MNIIHENTTPQLPAPEARYVRESLEKLSQALEDLASAARRLCLAPQFYGDGLRICEAWWDTHQLQQQIAAHLIATLAAENRPQDADEIPF